MAGFCETLWMIYQQELTFVSLGEKIFFTRCNARACYLVYFFFRNGVFPASASIDAHGRFIESNEPIVMVYNVTERVTVL
jgi:hypothetical protein